eukprot:maker-scaffold_54-snap-gene-0.40-mRNA-1 protein AED:0.46 eAED:0.46 QI:0/0/0/1/0/0/2/0/73
MEYTCADNNQSEQAAEVHRQVVKFFQYNVKPGIKLSDTCEVLENKNIKFVSKDYLNDGIGFPTGCILRYAAAH